MNRKELKVTMSKEAHLCKVLAKKLLKAGLTARNTVIVTVSTDYSSVVGQFLRHALSFEGEICDGFGIDVPYPDESWTERYVYELNRAFDNNSHLFGQGQILLLVEAGVIRGGNYKFVTEFIKNEYEARYRTLALFENRGSAYKSDFVGEYYDNETQDLTFWWEMPNNHWET